MKSPARKKRKQPEIVLREGKPSAVILDIDQYEELLERLEDIGDLKALQKMRSKTQSFRRFSDFLAESRTRV
ncbi:MAG: type II toxin-antitoxin system Phd/YefM family antitoxin [Planctomycetota bacterium]